MKVSVVIPLFNKAPYVAECLSSVLAQTHTELEVIVVDDASTDEGAVIVKAVQDQRLRLLTSAVNRGPGIAAQAGMDASTGTYVVRMDADDVMHPERIARQVEWMERHPGVDICGSAMDVLGRPDIVRRGPLTHTEITAQLLFGVGVFQPTMCLRRACLDRVGVRYNEAWPWYGEDRLFQLDAVLRGARLGALPDVLLHYREGPQNTVNRVDRKVATEALDAAVLTALGHIPPRSEQLYVHAFASKRFVSPPTAAQVTAFKHWLDHLSAWSSTVPALDATAVQRRCAVAWDELFHHLPFHTAETWRAYLAAGGRLTPVRMYYALRMWMTGPEQQRR